MTRARLRALLTAGGLLCGQSVLAQDAPYLDAPTFLGAYTWTQAIFQYVESPDGTVSLERGNFLGGRLVGGIGFGRVGAELRVDVAGLKGEFDVENPETYATLETFANIHFVAFTRAGMQVGPFIAAGSVASEESQGIGLDLWGAGVRLAGHGAEFHAAFARHDYLVGGGWRVSLSAHVPLKGVLYGVGDIVSGRTGFARVGLAVRLK